MGRPGSAVIDLMVEVERKRLRVEVCDGSAGGARPRPPDENGGWGLNLVDTLASRWGTRRSGELNVSWFEVDLPKPGS